MFLKITRSGPRRYLQLVEAFRDEAGKARFYHAVKEARLAHIVKVDLKGDLFAWHIDPDALALAELMDGKRLLVTNVKDLKPVDVVARYKSLADIERGFRILKSEIDIGPPKFGSSRQKFPATRPAGSTKSTSCDGLSIHFGKVVLCHVLTILCIP